MILSNKIASQVKFSTSVGALARAFVTGVVLILFLALSSSSTYAQTSWTGTVSSAWEVAGNWSAGVPGPGTAVTIGNASFTGANQPTISSAASIASLTFGTTRAATLTLNADLTLSGALTNTVNVARVHAINLSAGVTLQCASANLSTAVNGGNMTITFNGGTLNCMGNMTVQPTTATSLITFAVGTGALTVAGNMLAGTAGAGARGCAITVSTGTISFAGTFAKDGGNSTITSSGAATVTFNGNVTNTRGAFNLSGSTTIFSGSATITPTTAMTFGNVQINPGVTVTAGGALSVAGNWTNNGGTFTPGANTVTFTGNSASINGSSAAQTFNNIIVNKTVGQTLSVGGSTTSLTTNNFTETAGNFTAPATMDINGTLTITAGTFTAGTAMTVAVNWSQATGSVFAPGAGTVTFDGAGAQQILGTLAPKTFYNLVVNKTAATLLNTAGGTSITVGGNLTQTQGNFTPPATLTVTGSVTLTAGTFTAGTNVNVGGDWTNNGGAFTPGANTVTFTGNSASINGGSAAQTFNNIVVNKTAGQTLSVGGSTTSLTTNNFTETAGNFTAPATMDINGTLTITAGTFTAGTAMTVAVNWSQATGSVFAPGAGTVTFDGAAAQQILGTLAPKTFYNLVINKTAATLLNTAGGTSITVGGNLSQTQGNFTPPATLTVSGSVTLTAGTFTAGTNVIVGGDWTNNGGTFTPGANTVTFNNVAAAQSINGTAVTQTFGALVVNKPGQTLSVGGSTTTLALNTSITLTAGTFAVGTATAINLAGNWTNNGGSFSAGSTPVTISGAGRIIGGTATTTFGPLTIAASATVTMNNNNSCTNLTFVASGAASSFTHGGISSLTVSGNVTINQPTAGVITAWNINGGSSSVTGTTLVGGADNTAARIARIVVTTGSLNLGGAVTLLTGTSSAVADIRVTGTGSITFSSALNHNQGSLVFTAAGTMNFNSSYSFASGGAAAPVLTTFAGAKLNFAGDLTVSSAGFTLNATSISTFTSSATVTPTSNISFGHLTVNAGVTLTTANAAGTLTIAGNILVNGAGDLGGAGTEPLLLTGAAATIGGTGTISATTNVNASHSFLAAANLTLTGTWTIATTFTLTNNGTVTSTAAAGIVGVGTGTWTNAANSILNVSGPLMAVGTLNANAIPNTVNYAGAGQAVKLPSGAPATYNNLTLSGSGAVSMPASVMTIGGNFTTSGSESSTASQALTINGNVTLGAGTSFTSGAFVHTVRGNWTNNGGAFVPGTGTITFTANSAVIGGSEAAQTFNNVIVNKTAGQLLSVGGSTTTLNLNGAFTETTGNFTAPSTMSVMSNVTLTAGTFTAGSTISAAGNWTNNGGTFTAGTSTVTFTGAAAQAINGTAVTQTFYNLVVDKSALALTVGGSTTTLNVNDLTMTLGSFTSPATFNVSGNVTLTAGTFTTGTNTNVAGGWTNNGGSFAGAGTVSLNGGVQVIGGSAVTTFSNLTLAGTSAKTSNIGINISGALTVNQPLAMSGANVLTMLGSASQPTFSGLTEITGTMTWQATGVLAYTFNNAQTTVTFSAGDATRTFTLRAQPGINPTGYTAGHTVNRNFNASYSNWNTGTATLKLAYLKSEASDLGVTEATLKGFDGGIAPIHKLSGAPVRVASGVASFGSISYSGLSAVTLPAGEIALDDQFNAFYSIAAASWNLNTTWDAGSVPTAADDVFIDNNYPVTIPDAFAASAKSIIINSVATGLTVGGGASGTLSVGIGGVTNNSAGTGLTVSVGATVTITGAHLTNAGSVTNNGTIIVQ